MSNKISLILIFHKFNWIVDTKISFLFCDSFSYRNIEQDGGKLKALVEENQALLKVPAESRHWDRYLLFLDNMITRGLVDAVNCRYV